MKEKIPVGILGATGLVGQEFVRLLGDHPFFRIEFLSASSSSSGRLYRDVVRWKMGEPLPPEIGEIKLIETDPEAILKTGVRVVFSALPSDVALHVEGALREGGMLIFSNSSAYRMSPDVPILIPEVNHEHLSLVKLQRGNYRGAIITNSNCAVSGLVMALKPLYDEFGIREVTVSTYQSISGAGLSGLPAMDIASNLIPFIPGEEEKIERETRKILGELKNLKINPAPLKIHASCCRVPVRRGHLESVVVKLDGRPSPEDIKASLSSFKGLPQTLNLPTSPLRPLEVMEEEDRPQPVMDVFSGYPERAKGMTVTLGRLRYDGEVLKFFLLVNNTVRGAAGTSVLNAELALAEGLLEF